MPWTAVRDRLLAETPAEDAGWTIVDGQSVRIEEDRFRAYLEMLGGTGYGFSETGFHIDYPKSFVRHRATRVSVAQIKNDWKGIELFSCLTLIQKSRDLLQSAREI